MRPSRLLLLAPLLAAGVALAGPKAKEPDPLPVIVLTGISQFDGVFGQAKDVQDKLKGETETLKKARVDTNAALEVATDAPLETALAELQKKAEHKIKVISEGGMPKLNPEAAVPDNVQKGIDAVNGLVAAANHTISTATGLKADAVQLASACAAFPGQVPSLVKNPMEVISKGKVVGDDSKATTALPDRLQLLIDEATKIGTDVASAFGG
jgi:hypothetical protein